MLASLDGSWSHDLRSSAAALIFVAIYVVVAVGHAPWAIASIGLAMRAILGRLWHLRQSEIKDGYVVSLGVAEAPYLNPA